MDLPFGRSFVNVKSSDWKFSLIYGTLKKLRKLASFLKEAQDG